MTSSPSPGVPQTAAKAHVAALIAFLATAAAPTIVTQASQHLDPAWVASCLDGPSLGMLATAGTALAAAAAAWVGTYLKRNRPA